MNPVVIPWPADVACSRAATPWMRRATAFCSWRDACHWAPGPGSRAAEWGEDAPTQSSGDPRPRSPIAGAHLGRRAAAGGQRLRGRGPAGGGAAPPTWITSAHGRRQGRMAGLYRYLYREGGGRWSYCARRAGTGPLLVRARGPGRRLRAAGRGAAYGGEPPLRRVGVPLSVTGTVEQPLRHRATATTRNWAGTSSRCDPTTPRATTRARVPGS